MLAAMSIGWRRRGRWQPTDAFKLLMSQDLLESDHCALFDLMPLDLSFRQVSFVQVRQARLLSPPFGPFRGTKGSDGRAFPHYTKGALSELLLFLVRRLEFRSAHERVRWSLTADWRIARDAGDEALRALFGKANDGHHVRCHRGLVAGIRTVFGNERPNGRHCKLGASR